MPRFKKQVPSSHYFNPKYDSKERWISYWYQINEVLITNPSSVLEIGVGNKLVSDYLSKVGIKLTTCDFDKNLKPDFVADVRNLPFKNNKFDTVLCAEVLEHLPFDDFTKALKEIKRVSKKNIVLTLPHFSLTNVYIGAKIIPFIPKKEFTIKIDYPFQHQFTGEHYWEIGKKSFSLAKIKSEIKNSGILIKKSYYPKENPYHHFFVLKKSRNENQENHYTSIFNKRKQVEEN